CAGGGDSRELGLSAPAAAGCTAERHRGRSWRACARASSFSCLARMPPARIEVVVERRRRILSPLHEGADRARERLECRAVPWGVDEAGAVGPVLREQ